MKKGEGFTCAPIGGCWHGEDGGELTISRASFVIGLGAYLAFPDWPQVGSRG